LEPFSEIDSRPPINPSPSIWLLAVYLVAAGGENIGEFGDVTVILHPSLPKRESCLRPMYGRRRKAQEQL
jgi:hypothetical protein